MNPHRTPATNTKGNDMANWIWNVIGWTSNKDPKLEELRAENVTLRAENAELTEQNQKLLEENRKLIWEEKWLVNQTANLQREIISRNRTIVALNNRVTNFVESINRACAAVSDDSPE